MMPGGLPMTILTNNLGEQVRLDQVLVEDGHGGPGNGLQYRVRSSKLSSPDAVDCR